MLAYTYLVGCRRVVRPARVRCTMHPGATHRTHYTGIGCRVRTNWSYWCRLLGNQWHLDYQTCYWCFFAKSDVFLYLFTKTLILCVNSEQHIKRSRAGYHDIRVLVLLLQLPTNNYYYYYIYSYTQSIEHRTEYETKKLSNKQCTINANRQV